MMSHKLKNSYAVLTIGVFLVGQGTAMERAKVKSFEDLWTINSIQKQDLVAPLELYLSMLPTLLEDPEMKERLMQPLTDAQRHFEEEIKKTKDQGIKLRNKFILEAIKIAFDLYQNQDVIKTTDLVGAVKNQLAEQLENELKLKAEEVQIILKGEEKPEKISEKAKGLWGELQKLKHQFTQNKLVKEARAEMDKAIEKVKETAEEIAQKAKAQATHLATQAAESAFAIPLGTIPNISLQEAVRSYATSDRVSERKQQSGCPDKIPANKLLELKTSGPGNLFVAQPTNELKSALENSKQGVTSPTAKNAALVDARTSDGKHSSCRYMFRQKTGKTIFGDRNQNPDTHYFTLNVPKH